MNRIINIISRVKRKFTVIMDSHVKLALANNDKPNLFVFGVSSQINYGDLAISLAQDRFSQRFLKEFNYVEILDYQTSSGIKQVKKYITSDDVIAISGGGNVGNLYMFSENIRRRVVKNFPRNRIVSFPQSAFFTDDSEGYTELKKSSNIYSRNAEFILTAREDRSKELLENNFRNKIIFTPDIVLSLQLPIVDEQRCGILAVLRHDQEKRENVNKKQQDVLKMICKIPGLSQVKQSDNNIDKPRIVKRNMREVILGKRFKEFSESKLVVTDRLHGMIFSAITGTPCIIFDNSNGKVKHSYLNWLANQSNILLADSLSLSEIYKWTEMTINQSFTAPELWHLYTPLINAFKKTFEGN